MLSLVAALVGCGRSDVQVNYVPKEKPAAQENAMPHNHPDTAGGKPTLQWKLPMDWETAPAGQMRLASFRVKGADVNKADISIIPLPGKAGNDLDNVNRWRGQIGLVPVDEAEFAKLGEPVTITGQAGQLYDLAGQAPGSTEKRRILAAILRQEDTAWFFKMTGEDELVAKQKPAFVEFLKSLSFEAAAPAAPAAGDMAQAAPMAPAGVPAVADASKPAWEVPSGWQETPGGQFLVAKFIVTGENKAQAAVNVSSSVGDGGGLVSNVNRWRKQLGLTELPEAEVLKQVTTMDVASGKAMLTEMTGVDARTGQNSRLIGVMVPQTGRAWFYKLMGDAQVVEHEKELFIKFIQTAKYPNAT
jgi:hypothetical protein